MSKKTQNLVANGSFQKGLQDWTLSDNGVEPSIPSGVYRDGFARIVDWDTRFGFAIAHPTEGTRGLWTEWDGARGQIALTQTVSLAHTKTDVLHFDVQAGWDLENYGARRDRTFVVEVHDLKTDKVTDFRVLTAHAGEFETGDQVLHQTLDLSTFAGHQIALSFIWNIPGNYDGPASFELDNIQINADEKAGAAHGDRMVGSSLDDALTGLSGADTIEGGHGADILTGGRGADRFVFSDVADSRGVRVDEITDLAKKDIIDLSAIDADAHAVGDQAFILVQHFDGGRGEATLSWDRAAHQTVLSLDIDGDRTADMTVRIDGHHAAFDTFVL